MINGILACPKCSIPLNDILHCDLCGKKFKIIDQVPVLLIEEYKILDDNVQPTNDSMKELQMTFYTRVGEYLQGTFELYGNESAFNYLNFGYYPNNNKQSSPIELPQYCLNKNSIMLTLEVIGKIDLNGKKVLEVGCGRGGNLLTINEYYKPELLVGIDITEFSIRYNIRNHNFNNMHFLVGDAENIPLISQSFDIVFNLESSHAYPNRNKFYHEVKRVLKSGGIFLYSDILAPEEFMICELYLRDIGFEVVRDQDITSNVLLSCDNIANVRKGAFPPTDTERVNELLDNFVASPESKVYKSMKSREFIYKVLTLIKK